MASAPGIYRQRACVCICTHNAFLLQVIGDTILKVEGSTEQLDRVQRMVQVLKRQGKDPMSICTALLCCVFLVLLLLVLLKAF